MHSVTGPSSTTDKQALRVLVADDSPVQVHLLSGWLREEGYEVLVAADAMQAWMSALRYGPNAIILDVSMPGGSGIEVLKRLRASTRTGQIPVVIVSGSGGDRMSETVKRIGAAEFLQK